MKSALTELEGYVSNYQGNGINRAINVNLNKQLFKHCLYKKTIFSEFQTGWSWAVAVYCLIWELLAVIPVVFSRMSDKYGYDDLFWVYPPDFVLKAEKKNYFYKFCASFCLRLRFDYDSRVLPREDPDPLILRRPLSMPESVNRPKSSRSLSSSIELNKNTELEPNENQMNFDEAPLDETKGISDKYQAEVEPDAVSLRPDDKQEECNEEFKEVPLTNKIEEEECADDFKEVIFTNKPDEVTDDANTQVIDNSAAEKDNHLDISQCNVQAEEDDAANEWYSIVIASTPNDCTDLLSDAKFYSDDEGDNNNADDKPEELIDKKDTESLKVDKDDHLNNENLDVIDDTDNEKDKIEEKTDITPVLVPQIVESADISEQKDQAVDNSKEEKEGKGARRKNPKKKKKKKSKKPPKKEKSTDDPIPQQDFADVAQTIVQSKDIKDATKSKKKTIIPKREESTPDVSDPDSLKPANYLWRRLSRSIVRDFRQMQNNNNAHRSEDTEFRRDEITKADPSQLREDQSNNDSENKNSNDNYEDNEGLLPERSETLPEICVIMPEEDPEDATWKADYEALIREAEQSSAECDVFATPDEEMNITEENIEEDSGYRPKKMKPAWVNPLDSYKSQAVNAELSNPANKALQKAYSKKPTPQLPTPDKKVERKESIFSIGSSIPAIDI